MDEWIGKLSYTERNKGFNQFQRARKGPKLLLEMLALASGVCVSTPQKSPQRSRTGSAISHSEIRNLSENLNQLRLHMAFSNATICCLVRPPSFVACTRPGVGRTQSSLF